MTEYLTCLKPKIDKSIVALPVLKQVRRGICFFRNKHLDLQFSDFILKVLNNLLRLLVISKDIKNKRSQEIFISLFLPIPGK